MKRSKIKRLCLALLPALVLAGCGDSRDPEDRLYIFSIGVERQEGQYLFSLVPAALEGEEDREAITILADTLSDACVDAEKQESRSVYLGQLKTMVLGDSLLAEREALEALLDEAQRGVNISKKVMVLTTPDATKAAEAMAVKDGGLFLWEFYKNLAEDVAFTRGVDLETLGSALSEQGGYAVLPDIQTEEDAVRVSGSSLLLQEGSLRFGEQEEESILFLRGEGEGALLEVEIDGKKLPYAVSESRCRWVQEGDRPVLELCLKGMLGSGKGGEMFEKEKLTEVENALERSIKRDVENTIKIVRGQDADALQAIFPRRWGEPVTEAEIRVSVKISSIGRVK